MQNHLVTMMREYAQDHYYEDSWDVITKWSDEQIAAAIGGAKTRRGAISNAWGKIQLINAKRDVFQYGPKPTAPQSLFSFLAMVGGLKPHPDLAYVLDGNPRIRPYGLLVREHGMSLDRAREACVEAGYLFDAGAFSGAVTESSINDLLDLIRSEAHGDKQYPVGAELPDDYDYNRYGDEETFDEIPF